MRAILAGLDLSPAVERVTFSGDCNYHTVVTQDGEESDGN